MVRGRDRTVSALDSLSADLRALQQQVAALTASVDERLASLDGRQLDELDRIRAAVSAATDDLVERMNAVDARTRART
ncbi:MAG: hypothetical protein RLZZ362_1749 [Actinomycetota bacterium]|jgi:prefoldin subunit 5